MTSPVFTPLQMFYSTSGLPLTDGYIYIGTASQNPQTNPIAVYWDAAGTIPAAQPIRTSGGYPVRNGSPATVFVLATDFSLIVRDKSSKLVFSRLSGNAFSAEWVTYTPAGTGAVPTTVQAKLRESITPEDFGGLGDGVNADRTSVVNALATGRDVFLQRGKIYCCSATVTVPAGQRIYGGGTLKFTAGGLYLAAGAVADGIIVDGNSNTNAESGITINGSISGCKVLYCTIQNTNYNGIQVSNGAADYLLIGNNITNTGTAAIAVTGASSYLGHGIYLAGTGQGKVALNNISNTYGQGGIFLDSTNGVQVINNTIQYTYWAGIRGYNTTNPCYSTKILGNYIFRAGYINPSASAVGCNGIAYLPTSDADFYNWEVGYNTVNAPEENGIEGCGYFHDNIVLSSAASNRTTPSPEGIYTGGPCRIINNLVYNSRGWGIRVYRDGTEAAGTVGDVEVTGNTTKDPINGWGIQVSANNVAGSISNVRVERNTTFNGGIQISATAGATYGADSWVTGNRAYGGLGNASVIDASVVNQSGNSFDSTYAVVASASTITVPPSAVVVSVTGTTTITSITAGKAGRGITLVFAGILTLTDGSNLKLAGNFVTTADDTINLVSDGTNWYETGRAVN